MKLSFVFAVEPICAEELRRFPKTAARSLAMSARLQQTPTGMFMMPSCRQH